MHLRCPAAGAEPGWQLGLEGEPLPEDEALLQPLLRQICLAVSLHSLKIWRKCSLHLDGSAWLPLGTASQSCSAGC